MNFSRRSAAIFIAASLSASAGFGQETLSSRAPASEKAPSFAAASKQVQELRRSLLEKRWEYSKENRAAAAAEYAAIKASGEATPADDLLYGVVRFRQHEYAPSAEALNSALAAMPEDRLTLKTRIWTAVERDELDVVWPLLSRLQRLVFARTKDPAITEAAKRDDLLFLGQLHGYLAGPYGELKDDRLLVSLRDEIAMNLRLEDLSVFEAAERGVEERHEALLKEREILLAEVEAEAKAAAEAKLAELTAREEDLKAEQAELDPAREKIVEGAREPLGALTEAEALVGTTFETLNRQAEALRVQYEGTLDAMSRAYFLLRTIEDDELAMQLGSVRLSRWDLEREIWRLRATLRAIETQMTLLEQNHAQLNFNFAQIRQRRIARETEMQRNVARIAWDAAKIERELRLLKEQTEKIGVSDRSASPLLRELDKDLKVIETYVDFTLETPREAALSALEGS